jgi:hypothetical protein
MSRGAEEERGKGEKGKKRKGEGGERSNVSTF